MKKNLAILLSIVVVSACSAKRANNKNGQISNNVSVDQVEQKLKDQSVKSTSTASSGKVADVHSGSDSASSSSESFFDDSSELDQDQSNIIDSSNKDIQSNNSSLFLDSVSSVKNNEEVLAEVSQDEIEFQNALTQPASEGEKKEAFKLQQLAQTSIKETELQPGFPTWYGVHKLGLEAKAGTMKGVAWSTRFSYQIATSLGYDMDLLLKEKDGVKSIDWTNAAIVRDNLIAKVDSSIREVTSAQAQILANKGRVVLATSIQKDKSFIRMGVVAPSVADYKQEKGARITTAAPAPDFYYESDFMSAGSEKVQFFALQKSVSKKLDFDAKSGSALFNKIVSSTLAKNRSVKMDGVVEKIISRDLSSTELSDIIEKTKEEKKLSSEEAQQQANLGKIVIVVMNKENTTKLGVVTPDQAQFNVKVGAKVAMKSSDVFATESSLKLNGVEVSFYLAAN